MSHRIPIACVARLGEGDLAVLAVHIGDTGQALNAEAALTELIAAALEALLHGNTDAGKEVIAIYSHNGYQKAQPSDYDSERAAQKLIQELSAAN